MADVINLENYKLKVDTGAVRIPVVDMYDEPLGEFKFNPNDWDIIKRYEQVAQEMDKVEIPDEASEEDLFRLCDFLKEQVNFLLGYNVSDGLFGRCNPLSMTASGDFYIEMVLDGIAGLIEQVTDQRLTKRKNKIKKATSKYHN